MVTRPFSLESCTRPSAITLSLLLLSDLVMGVCCLRISREWGSVLLGDAILLHGSLALIPEFLVVFVSFRRQECCFCYPLRCALRIVLNRCCMVSIDICHEFACHESPVAVGDREPFSPEEMHRLLCQKLGLLQSISPSFSSRGTAIASRGSS